MRDGDKLVPLAAFQLDAGRVIATYNDPGYRTEIETNGIGAMIGGQLKVVRPGDGAEFYDAIDPAYSRSTLMVVSVVDEPRAQSAAALTRDDLEHYLRTAGWKFERIDERTLGLAFRGDAATFPFFIRLTDAWIFFTIVPFVKMPDDDRAQLAIYRRLLQLNRTMNLAKFALDEDGDIVLTVELPTEATSASALDDALAALTLYANAHYVELRDLAARATR